MSELLAPEELPSQSADEKPLDRDDLLACFMRVCNLVQPDHPYQDDESEPYPIEADDVDYGYKQASSSMWASCGPKFKRRDTEVGYSVDKEYMNDVCVERHLAILVHEVTHVTEGSHTDGSAHHPRFWETMADNALIVLDEIESVEAVMGSISREGFLAEIIDDPNSHMVDQRMETALERKRQMARDVGVDPDNPEAELGSHIVETVDLDLETDDRDIEEIARTVGETFVPEVDRDDRVKFTYEPVSGTSPQTVYGNVNDTTHDGEVVVYKGGMYTIVGPGWKGDRQPGEVVKQGRRIGWLTYGGVKTGRRFEHVGGDQ